MSTASALSRRSLLLTCAALVGAGGLGIETLLVSSAGLSMGYGRSGAVGLSAWIAGWALGAFVGGRVRILPLPAWPALGLAAAACGWFGAYELLRFGGTLPNATLATCAGAFVIALAGFAQGPFLPWLARVWDPARGGASDVSLLFAANLVGSVAGAQWIGFRVAAEWGRFVAVGVAGGATLVGAVVGMVAVGWGAAGTRTRTGAGAGAGRPGSSTARLSMRVAGIVVGLATVMVVGVEWVGLRLGTLWLDGMQPALSAVLAASLIALAVGSVLVPALVPRGPSGIAWVFGLAAGAAVWFLHSAPWLASIDAKGRPLLFALVLLGPPLLPLGAVIPTVHRCVAGESGRRLGTLVLHEVWGAAIGVPLLHWFVVPAFGLGGALAVLCLLAAVCALTLVPVTKRASLGAAAVCLAAGAWIGRAPEPALASPALANPAFSILAFAEDSNFAVTVVEDGLRGERTILTDTFRATAVGDDYMYMRVLGHLPLLLHPRPRRTCVLAFGTGTTAGAVALHPEVERIDVLELSRAVCAQAAFFADVNRGVLEEERTSVFFGDGRRTLAAHPGAYDVVTMEPLLPDSPLAVYLYTEEFYARVRAALAPGGLLCQWVPPHALEPGTFDVVVDAFARAFGWSGVFVFGTQVILIGGESAPALDPLRFPAPGTALHGALAELGLETAPGLFARFVTSGALWPRSDRPLTDADPWIVYRPRRRGAVLLTDLPLNLRRMRALESEPPESWKSAVSVEAWKRLEAVRLLHRAREAWAVWDAERRGAGVPPDPTLFPVDQYLTVLGGDNARDPEVRHLAREVGFVRALNAGFAALAGGHDGAALDELTRAATLRPREAQVHLLVALAALRTGNPNVARAAARKAYEQCPRILETPAGKRAIGLGLPPELLPAAVGSAN